jgi:acetolactate synthase-1/2/3 large subunit
VLCISGQIDSKLIGLGRGVLHEVRDQQQAIAPVTKWQGFAATVAEIPGLVRQAFVQLQSGRPRPVEIEIPQDVLAQEGEVCLVEPAYVCAPEAEAAAIEHAASLFAGASRPLIMAGGGVIGAGASAELCAVAEALSAPVIMTNTGGRGALSDRHPLAFSDAAMRQLVPQADAVLAVGTRFAAGVEPRWRWSEKKVVQLDIDPQELGRNHPPQIAIEADAKAGLAALEQALRQQEQRSTGWEGLPQVHAQVLEAARAMQPQHDLGVAIREALPEDGILVSECTQVGYWARHHYPVYEPRTYIASGYQGTLGHGFANAIGVQIGQPDRRVVSINGDGGFFYNLQELSTLARLRLPLVVVVFNDSRFGNVSRIQDERFGRRHIGVELYNPDFMELAHAFSIRGRRALGASSLHQELRQALDLEEPTLIEVPVGWMEYFAGRPARPEDD